MGLPHGPSGAKGAPNGPHRCPKTAKGRPNSIYTNFLRKKKAPAGTPKGDPGFFQKKKAPAGTPKGDPGFLRKKKAPAGTPTQTHGLYFQKCQYFENIKK